MMSERAHALCHWGSKRGAASRFLGSDSCLRVSERCFRVNDACFRVARRWFNRTSERVSGCERCMWESARPIRGSDVLICESCAHSRGNSPRICVHDERFPGMDSRSGGTRRRSGVTRRRFLGTEQRFCVKRRRLCGASSRLPDASSRLPDASHCLVGASHRLIVRSLSFGGAPAALCAERRLQTAGG